MTLPITKMWLVRHGEPDERALGRCYGSLDFGLSRTGVIQARQLARTLSTAPLSAIYSSPRVRCRDTAAIIAERHHCEVVTLPEIAEMNFGQFEGRTYNEIAASHPVLYAGWMTNPTQVQFPGGETFNDMFERVTRTASGLRARHQGQTFAVITHGGVNRILLSEALGMCRENMFRIGQRYAALNLIQHYGDQPGGQLTVELINGCPGGGKCIGS